MKKLFIITMLFLSFFAEAQTKQKYVRWQNYTTAQRDAIDVSDTSVTYEVYNIETNQKEHYNNVLGAWAAGGGASTASTITALPYATIPATNVQAWLEDLKDEIDALAISAGAVTSVNGQAGTVVLTTDNIDDSAAANKYVTASEKAAISTAVQTETDPLFAAWAYNYNNLVNTPTNLSEFTNDAGFITAAGNVTKVGTPVNNQLGVWTGDGTIKGDSNITWDGLNLDLTGASVGDQLRISRAGAIKFTLLDGTQTGTKYVLSSYNTIGSVNWLLAEQRTGGVFNRLSFRWNNSNTLSFLPDRKLAFDAYGTGTITGTPTYNLAVDASGNVIETALGSGGSTTFSALTDTPSSYTGQAGKAALVNTGETALEYKPVVKLHENSTIPLTIWAGLQADFDSQFPSGAPNEQLSIIPDATPPALYAMDISVIPSGNQTASDGQTAIDLLQSQIDAISSGSSTFTGLTDTPPNYTGHANKFLVVADNELSVKYSSMNFDENTAALNMLGDGGADDAAYIKVNDTEMFKLAQGNDFISTQRPFSALSGLTASGINASSQKITNVANGTLATDAVNKGQLDAINTAISVSSGAVAIGTGTGITGSSGFTWDSLNKNLNMNLGVNSDAAITFGGESNARFSYSELGSNRFTFNRNISLLSNKIINLADGTDPNDAVNKSQLDAAIAGVSGGLQATSIDTSAELASIVSDETGSGALVFGTSPTLTTPNLGTPSAVNLTNATGLPHTAITGMNGTITTLLATSPNTSTGLITGGGTVTLTNKAIPLGSNTLTGLVTTGLGAVIDMGRMAQYNFGAASSATTFTMTNIAVGGEAAVLVNSATEPTVTGATKLPNTATFIANTDMVLFVKDFNGTRKYYFMQF